MTFVNPDYTQTHNAEAIVDELGLGGLLTKEQMRRVETAIGMLNENTDDLTRFLANTSQRAPVYSADPPQPVDGEMWINSTTNQFKIRKNGSTVVIV